MQLIIGFLTFILVVDCLFLILLILIQLPKKEAGAGVAFGGAATDALFGAGSGNALTKMTKYTASIFIVLALGLSLMNSNQARSGRRKLDEELRKKMNTPAAFIPSAATSNNANPVSISQTQTVQITPVATATNVAGVAVANQVAPAAAATNNAAQPAATNSAKPAAESPAPANSSAPAQKP